MIIYPDFCKPYLIDNLTGPVIPKYYWTFSGPMLDFCLSPISYLEETTGPVVTLEVNGFKFDVPAHWNILITDTDTWQLDTIPITNCSNQKSSAYLMSTNEYTLRTADVKIVDYFEMKVLVHPLVAKGHGLCHPAGTVMSYGKEVDVMVTITPHDLYKFIGEKAVGDILP